MNSLRRAVRGDADRVADREVAASSAVSASITTSSGPLRPAARDQLQRVEAGLLGSMPKPKVGFPFGWIVLPSRPISFACVESPFRSMSAPAAAATSGSARTRRAAAGETVALPLVE